MMGSKKTQVGGNHYLTMGIMPWDVIDTWPIDQQIGFHRGTVQAYVMRAGSKGDMLEDLEKAQHCLGKLIEVIKNARIV